MLYAMLDGLTLRPIFLMGKTSFPMDRVSYFVISSNILWYYILDIYNVGTIFYLVIALIARRSSLFTLAYRVEEWPVI